MYNISGNTKSECAPRRPRSTEDSAVLAALSSLKKSLINELNEVKGRLSDVAKQGGDKNATQAAIARAIRDIDAYAELTDSEIDDIVDEAWEAEPESNEE